MNNELTNYDALKRQAEYFYKTQKPVHIKFKEKFFKNGTIIELGGDFFMLVERLEGLMPIFYLEIMEIREYKEKKI